MRRKTPTLLMTSAVILFALLIPTVFASKPIAVSGTWFWYYDGDTYRFVDGNIFMSATEHDTFSGTFVGTGEGPFTVTIHPNGFVTGIGRTTLDVTVLEKSGTLVIQWTGNIKMQGKWRCKWVILSGTEDLANLRGSGIGVETAPGSCILELSGKIHFDPS